jgi:hypothetical protein
MKTLTKLLGLLKKDRLRDGGMVLVGILVVIAIVGATSRFYMGGPDREIEEAAEEILESTTGAQIDLSPDTPDPDHE